MTQFPTMPLYCADLLADTSHLTPEVFAVYTRILYTMWLADGTVPDDDHFLAHAGGVSLRKWRSLRTEVMTFLMHSGDDRLTQKKLMKTRRKVAEIASKNKNNAKIRWARQRAYPSKNNHQPHASAYASADANGYASRARLQNQIDSTDTSHPTSDPLPRADALGASPTGPPSELPISDALLNTKLVKKGH